MPDEIVAEIKNEKPDLLVRTLGDHKVYDYFGLAT